MGDFCFGVFHAPLWQSNPTCYAQMEDLSFNECFSQMEKKSMQNRSAAIHPHSEDLWADALRCTMWWAELSLQKCICPSLLELLSVYLKGGFGLFRLQVIEIDCWATCEIQEVEFSLHLFSAVQSQSNSTDFGWLEEDLFWCYKGRSVPGRLRWCDHISY